MSNVRISKAKRQRPWILAATLSSRVCTQTPQSDEPYPVRNQSTRRSREWPTSKVEALHKEYEQRQEEVRRKLEDLSKRGEYLISAWEKWEETLRTADSCMDLGRAYYHGLNLPGKAPTAFRGLLDAIFDRRSSSLILERRLQLLGWTLHPETIDPLQPQGNAFATVLRTLPKGTREVFTAQYEPTLEACVAKC